MDVSVTENVPSRKRDSEAHIYMTQFLCQVETSLSCLVKIAERTR
jgi:hypothetical protein